MGSAVIDQRDKVFSDGGPVQDELRKTLGGGIPTAQMSRRHWTRCGHDKQSRDTESEVRRETSDAANKVGCASGRRADRFRAGIR